MPRYDASKDEVLKDSIQSILERQFFLCQYNKRRFITDNNILFFEDYKEDTNTKVVETFCRNKFNYIDVIKIYKDLIGKISDEIKGFVLFFVDLDNDEYTIIEHLFKIATETIDDLQLYLLYYHFNLFQREIEPNIINLTVCEKLLKYDEIKIMIMQLTLISIKYRLFISDLCSSFPEIEIKPSIDKADPSLCRMFSHYSDFNPRTNPCILQENECIYRKRLTKYIENTRAGAEISRLEAAAAKKASKGLIPGAFYASSTLKRCAGLWLWDACVNPVTEDRISKTKAIEKLREHKFFNGHKNKSLDRELHRIFDVTRKCIEKGELLPIEDGKKKTVSKLCRDRK